MLTLVATPIGNMKEISLLGLEVLQNAEVIICESTKEASKFLRSHGISGKIFEILNEHSTADDLYRLLQICESKNVALVTDCGTPGFCDPGSDLVDLCYKKNISVKNCLGPSALMGLISLCGLKLNHFWFQGFIPQESQERQKAYGHLRESFISKGHSVILMDTPYRLQKMILEIDSHFPNHVVVLALNLGTNEEKILKGTSKAIQKQLTVTKAEFMILITTESSK